MKPSNIYLIAAVVLLLACVGFVSYSGNGITGAAIGNGNVSAPIIFTIIIAIVFFGLILIRQVEVSKNVKK